MPVSFLCGRLNGARYLVRSAKAIDRYVELRTAEESGGLTEKMDPRLQDIIESIFTRCIDDGEYKQVGGASRRASHFLSSHRVTFQALGVALESARLDIVTRIYELTKDTQLLSYVIDAVLDSGFKLAYRNKVRLPPHFGFDPD